MWVSPLGWDEEFVRRVAEAAECDERSVCRVGVGIRLKRKLDERIRRVLDAEYTKEREMLDAYAGKSGAKGT